MLRFQHFCLIALLGAPLPWLEARPTTFAERARSTDIDEDAVDKLCERVVDKAIERLHASFSQRAMVYEDHSTWENPWVVASEHYVVRSSWGYLYAKEMGKDLDTMFDYFLELSKPLKRVSGKANVFVLPDQPAYNSFGDDNGDHHSSMYGSFYAAAHAQKPIATCWHPNKTLVKMWATHSAWHEFAQRAFAGVQHPAPLDEGLAAYFAAFWDWDWTASLLEKLIAERRFIRLRKLMRTDSDAYGARANDYFVQFAMLFRFMRYDYPPTADKEGEVGPFVKYVRRALAGDNVSQSPIHKLLFEDMNKLESAFLAHLEKIREAKKSK